MLKSKRCVRFHYIARGSAWISAEQTNEPRLALSGGDLVAKASRLTGYASEASFSHAFRQWSGIAPGAWRRKSKGNERAV